MRPKTRQSVPEYRIVAFLKDGDRRQFYESVKRFPPSCVIQLPPHLTILNMIFSDKPIEEITQKIETAIQAVNITSCDISTNGILVWHNLKYNAYSIAVSVEPNEDLIKLRIQLERALEPITIPEEDSLWAEYMPHLTISISVGAFEAQQAKMLSEPPPMKHILDSIELLRHGGEYFGYTRIKQFKLR